MSSIPLILQGKTIKCGKIEMNITQKSPENKTLHKPVCSLGVHTIFTIIHTPKIQVYFSFNGQFAAFSGG